jgi:mycothiol synthase
VQGALAAWVREAGACGYCHAGEVAHRIYENLRGRRPVGELVQVWEDGSAAVVGLAIALRLGSTFDVYVSPALRGGSAEAEMIEWAWETTRRFAREPGDVGTDVFGCDAVRIEVLTRLGFERYRLWDHVRERSLTRPVPEPRLPPGFALRPATMADAEGLAEVRNGAFREDWTAETYRAEVMLKPGYRPERELTVVSPAGQVVAFAVTWLDAANRVGHFEPVGTHPAFRRRGLARALMRHGLRELRTLGMDRATIEHLADNVPALELYRGLGFEKRCETFGYRPR